MRKILFFIFAAVLFSACATQQRIVTVTEYRDMIRTDTIEMLKTDSIYIAHHVREKGDTILMRDTIFRYRVIHDTETKMEYIRDSIPYEVEVVREVRRRNGYDKFTSAFFWIFILAIFIRIGWWIMKKYYRL